MRDEIAADQTAMRGWGGRFVTAVTPAFAAGTRLARKEAGSSARGMTTPITVTIPHQLGRAEARRRLENGFGKFAHVLPGGAGKSSQRWEGDRLAFSVGALGQTVSGVIDVLDTAVTMEIQLPGVLGLLAGGLRNRLQKAGTLMLTKK